MTEEKEKKKERRQARCQCGQVVESEVNLPFFKERPDHEYDEYYCGCRGWD